MIETKANIMRNWAKRNSISLYFMGYCVFYFGFIGRYALDFASVGEFTAGGALGWTLGMTSTHGGNLNWFAVFS